jgi:phosphate:Na+ symporter
MEVFLKTAIQILTLIGAVGLFLYGMKVMSESLQKMAGKRIRNWLTRNISSPWKGILAGTLITGTIQSSSATMVMLVSFVNAGLLSFTASLGLIFGANIGTTATAWIISLAGINSGFDFYIITLPLIGLSIPLLLSGKSYYRIRAEFIIGFAIMFIGIYLFKQHIPQIDETSKIFQMIHSLSSIRIINLLLLVLLGIIITVLFQSSSATTALTIVLAAQGWLSLEESLAMILGENIGTTFTAILAAMVANRTAKRTALAHLLFNVMGVVWVLIFFGGILSLVQGAITSFHHLTGKPLAAIIPIGIAIFHTGFNIVNTLLFTAFFRQFDRFCCNILPNGDKEDFALKYIDSGMISMSELSIVQVKMEIAHLGGIVTQLYLMIPDLLVEKNERKFAKKLRSIQNIEDGVDKLELDIAGYITRTFQSNLSAKESQRLRAMLKMIDNLESIADMSYQMSLTISRKNQASAWFTPGLRQNINLLFGLVGDSLQLMKKHLGDDYGKIDFDKVKTIELEINDLRNKLKKDYLDGLKNNEFPYQTGVFYNDMLGLLEKIGDHVFNVNYAIYSAK